MFTYPCNPLPLVNGTQLISYSLYAFWLPLPNPLRTSYIHALPKAIVAKESLDLVQDCDLTLTASVDGVAVTVTVRKQKGEESIQHNDLHT